MRRRDVDVDLGSGVTVVPVGGGRVGAGVGFGELCCATFVALRSGPERVAQSTDPTTISAASTVANRMILGWRRFATGLSSISHSH